MSNLKTSFGKLMNSFMLSCEEATLLMTRKQLKKLSIFKSIQLKMHLISCKLCRRFEIQNEIIHNVWDSFTSENTQLSDEKKEVINSEIDAQMQDIN